MIEYILSLNKIVLERLKSKTFKINWYESTKFVSIYILETR